jgi:hypothetical protein
MTPRLPETIYPNTVIVTVPYSGRWPDVVRGMPGSEQGRHPPLVSSPRSSEMEGDRKYRQRGYMDGDGDRPRGEVERERPRQQGPRPPIDVTGPRLPRLVQTVTAARCWNCATTLPPGTDFKAPCPKCMAPLHCCKQCRPLRTLHPFPVPQAYSGSHRGQGSGQRVRTVRAPGDRGPRRAPHQLLARGIRGPDAAQASDARAAFDNLFKK